MASVLLLGKVVSLSLSDSTSVAHVYGTNQPKAKLSIRSFMPSWCNPGSHLQYSNWRPKLSIPDEREFAFADTVTSFPSLVGSSPKAMRLPSTVLDVLSEGSNGYFLLTSTRVPSLNSFESWLSIPLPSQPNPSFEPALSSMLSAVVHRRYLSPKDNALLDEAELSEFHLFQVMKVYESVPVSAVPPTVTPLFTKWVYTRKEVESSSLGSSPSFKYKARLVARGDLDEQEDLNLSSTTPPMDTALLRLLFLVQSFLPLISYKLMSVQHPCMLAWILTKLFLFVHLRAILRLARYFGVFARPCMVCERLLVSLSYIFNHNCLLYVGSRFLLLSMSMFVTHHLFFCC